MTEIRSIGSLCAPQFSVSRHAYTGAGWYVGVGNVHYTDGTRAIHEIYVCKTRGEADELYREMRGKLT